MAYFEEKNKNYHYAIFCSSLRFFLDKSLHSIKDCAREWNKHRKTGDRFIHADEIRDFLKTDTTVFKYKFGNKWIVNYDQLLPHLKKINRRESKMWKKYMQCLGIKKSVTPRKK